MNTSATVQIGEYKLCPESAVRNARQLNWTAEQLQMSFHHMPIEVAQRLLNHTAEMDKYGVVTFK